MQSIQRALRCVTPVLWNNRILKTDTKIAQQEHYGIYLSLSVLSSG